MTAAEIIATRLHATFAAIEAALTKEAGHGG